MTRRKVLKGNDHSQRDRENWMWRSGMSAMFAVPRQRLSIYDDRLQIRSRSHRGAVKITFSGSSARSISNEKKESVTTSQSQSLRTMCTNPLRPTPSDDAMRTTDAYTASDTLKLPLRQIYRESSTPSIPRLTVPCDQDTVLTKRTLEHCP